VATGETIARTNGTTTVAITETIAGMAIGMSIGAITKTTAGMTIGVSIGAANEATTASHQAIGRRRGNTARGSRIDQPATSPRLCGGKRL
jgi:hypothetical protein